jgi:GNAT superfamily N-acetyltransferase
LLPCCDPEPSRSRATDFPLTWAVAAAKFLRQRSATAPISGDEPEWGMSALTIRSLGPLDEPRWRELWAGYLDFYETELAPEVTAAQWHRLLDPEQDPHGLCAVDTGGAIVGFVHYQHQRTTWLIDDCIYLEDLYVDRVARGSGVGRALIEAVYRVAADENLTEVYWMTQDFNHTARKLYDAVATLTPFVKYKHVLQRATDR